MSKKQLIRLLDDNGYLDLTVSCWNARLENNQVVSCHQCANCLERDGYIKSLKEKK